MTVLRIVCENISEVESSDSNNEIGGNQESDCKSDTSDCELVKVAHQTVNKVTGRHLHLSVCGMMWSIKWRSGSWASTSCMMSVPDFIEILRVVCLCQYELIFITLYYKYLIELFQYSLQALSVTFCHNKKKQFCYFSTVYFNETQFEEWELLLVHY
jgi:hypothetical protein